MTTIPMVDGRPLARRRASIRRNLIVVVVVLLVLIAVAWTAITVQPQPFAPITPGGEAERASLPKGLPAPVEHYYRQRYGERVPLIHSVVISGRGTMRIPQLFNVQLPVRFRFIHDAGRNYRHYIEVTLFGLPALKVNEYYVDGKERQELPWAVAADNPKLDQGGNLGMWAELLQWAPSVLVTDPRVRWEAIDNESALLVVPFGNQEERFVVRFSPTTGELLYWEVMRYAGGEGEKTLWVNGTWFEDGRPWFLVTQENIVTNVAVDISLSAKGP